MTRPAPRSSDFRRAKGIRSLVFHARPAYNDAMKVQLQAVYAFGLCILSVVAAPTAHATCALPPPGLLAWYTGDNDANDLTGTHNPSATAAVTVVPAKVANGLAFSTGGYVDIPQSAGFAPQQFSLDAWVRPDGPGPNDDVYGSIIFTKNINRLNGVQSSLLLGWIATDGQSNNVYRFTVYVQTTSFNSTNQYPPGQFYHVALTSDGATVKLYVNGVLDNQIPLSNPIEYDSSVPYTIGSNFSGFRSLGFARTWNGIIDEL